MKDDLISKTVFNGSSEVDAWLRFFRQLSHNVFGTLVDGLGQMIRSFHLRELLHFFRTHLQVKAVLDSVWFPSIIAVLMLIALFKKENGFAVGVFVLGTVLYAFYYFAADLAVMGLRGPAFFTAILMGIALTAIYFLLIKSE
jgi:hypothetical protein